MNRLSGVRKSNRTWTLEIEILESRTLLSVVCDHGYRPTLTVEGTSADDTIKVTAIRSSQDYVKKVVVKMNGKPARTCSRIDLVVINAGDGNDNVTVGRFWSSFPELDVFGGPGNDTLRSVKSTGLLEGETGDDTLIGDLFDDYLYGGDGNDLLIGGAWSDTLDGGHGDDTIYGGEDDDLIDGGSGSDLIFGELGDDILEGSEDDDTIMGGSGADRINGGQGIDRMDGGIDLDIICDQSVGDIALSGVALLNEDHSIRAELMGERGSVEVRFGSSCWDSPFNYRAELQVDVSYDFDRIADGTYGIALDGLVIGSVNVRNGSGLFRASTSPSPTEAQLTETIESVGVGSIVRIGDFLEGVLQ